LKAPRRHLQSIVVTVLLIAPLAAQSIVVSTTGGMVRVRSAFGFIEGDVLDRLRDGRSLRLDFELSVLAEPRGSVVAAARQSFNLSFDLWEERVAVTRIGKPTRSVSHLRPRDAEVWCLENLTLASTELGRLTRDTPFWIRLAYTAPDVPAMNSREDETYTLRRLIDVLSRRPRDGDLGKTVEAGPFRLSQ
jgi:hypothetical protein